MAADVCGTGDSAGVDRHAGLTTDLFADPFADPFAEGGIGPLSPAVPPPGDAGPEADLLQILLDVVDMVPAAMENAKRAAVGKLLDEGGHVERLDEFRFQVTPANTSGRAPAAKRNRRYDVLILPGVGSSCRCRAAVNGC